MIKVRTTKTYRALGKTYLSLRGACYRLAKAQLLEKWFERTDNGGYRTDSNGNLIAHYSLYQMMVAADENKPFESKEELEKYKESEWKHHISFNSEKWLKMKREKAKEIAAQFKQSQKESA